MNEQIGSVSLDDWKAYLRWRTIDNYAPTLTKAFVDEDFQFNGAYMSGQKEIEPRWKRCVQSTDQKLGMALGQLYVDKTFGPQGKERTLKMVQAIEAAMHQDIGQLTWMSDTTKQKAYEKLSTIVNNIGYPDKWRDYSTVIVTREDYAGNVTRASAFEVQRQRNKIQKPTDKRDWSMTPPTVNAYYRANMNDINFPAGILQPPFYSQTMDDAVNYGAIGVVIGHELTHGFDDQGRKFDADGNLKDWWTAGRRQGLRRARHLHRRRVLRLRGGEGRQGRSEAEWAPDAGRKHGRQRRPEAGLYGADQHHRQHTGQAHRRLHGPAALLPGLRPDLVSERNRSAGAEAGHHRSAFARALAGERRGAELGRVRGGVRLQGRPAHGSRKCLPGMVRL